MNLYHSIVNDKTIKKNKQNFLVAAGFNLLNDVALQLVKQGFTIKSFHMTGSLPAIEIEHDKKNPLTESYSITHNGGVTRYAVRRKVINGVKVESYKKVGVSEGLT